MPLVNSILLTLALSWSWCVISEKTSVDLDIQDTIKADVQKIITTYFAENVPHAKNLSIHKIFTEVVHSSQIKTHFTYSFLDEPQGKSPATIRLSGFALLNKIQPLSSDLEQWNFDQLTIENETIEFSEPLRITTDNDE